MYPLSFDEFLMALGEERLLALKNKCSPKQPLDTVFHNKLIEYLKTYYLIGGMPEVVSAYAEKRDFPYCGQILDDLLLTIYDDFAKYKKRSPIARLKEVFDSVAAQAGGKFKYSKIESQSGFTGLKDALDLLVCAGLAYKIHQSSARGIPLGAQVKQSKFKAILFDTGIHQRLQNLNIREFLPGTNFNAINKGSIAEVFVGLELMHIPPANIKPQLYYWHRENAGSSAEVDYVAQAGDTLFPVEVKAGTTEQMQSMHLFLKERNLNKGIRISLENFCSYDKITVIPLYAVSSLENFAVVGTIP